MKKVIFLDRDGTLIDEPIGTEQVDSFDVLKFEPIVFESIRSLLLKQSFELVMVTNQDGLGTETFPEKDFWPVQNFVVNTCAAQGVPFADIHIDRTRPEDGAPTRKPGTALLHRYMQGDYDLAGSWVIGDRLSDVELAANLGARSALYDPRRRFDSSKADVYARTWPELVKKILTVPYRIPLKRNTREVQLQGNIVFQGAGKSEINTGLPFYDHMLEQISRHGGIDLNLTVQGDLEVDEHHTVEDVAIELGKALAEEWKSSAGRQRYGFALPMDDAAAEVRLDLGGRFWLDWEVALKGPQVGGIEADLWAHFFRSFAENARMNLYVRASGENDHHIIESVFKAFARALKAALRRDESLELPTTKGQFG
ncbi:histidinol-phosphatase [Cryomorphaceae bacterium]|nr:histidinol-phosphatase [Cryomorphaceae bacterium]